MLTQHATTPLDASIGEGVVVKGVLKVPGLVRIEGRFEGELSAQSLIVGHTGEVVGQAQATRVEVWGQMSHQVQADHLIIHGSGAVRGRTRYAELEIARGGVLEGQINRAPTAASTPGNAAVGPDAFR